MDTFVTCPCGHTLATHDGGGCGGERLRPCGCRRDRTAALEAAVRAVRSPYTTGYLPRPGASA
jgi:hypothetical protein